MFKEIMKKNLTKKKVHWLTFVGIGVNIILVIVHAVSLIIFFVCWFDCLRQLGLVHCICNVSSSFLKKYYFQYTVFICIQMIVWLAHTAHILDAYNIDLSQYHCLICVLNPWCKNNQIYRNYDTCICENFGTLCKRETWPSSFKIGYRSICVFDSEKKIC